MFLILKMGCRYLWVHIIITSDVEGEIRNSGITKVDSELTHACLLTVLSGLETVAIALTAPVVEDTAGSLYCVVVVHQQHGKATAMV